MQPKHLIILRHNEVERFAQGEVTLVVLPTDIPERDQQGNEVEKVTFVGDGWSVQYEPKTRTQIHLFVPAPYEKGEMVQVVEGDRRAGDEGLSLPPGRVRKVDLRRLGNVTEAEARQANPPNSVREEDCWPTIADYDPQTALFRYMQDRSCVTERDDHVFLVWIQAQ